MLRFNPEVRFGFFDERAGLVLHYASVWSLAHQTDVEVNSAWDAVHGATSLHPADLAWNFHTFGHRPADLKVLARYLGNRLPAGYDVVCEADHVHVEYDLHRKV